MLLRGRFRGCRGLLVLMLSLAGCGVVAAPPPAQPPLGIDRSALATGSSPAPAGAVLAYTIKRGTIRETLAIPGKIVPTHIAELLFHGAGTITSVNVHSGQAVTKDEVLAELTLAPDTLEAARSRAAMADLAYEAQLARVAELQRGAGADAIAAARADVVKAQAAVSRAQLGRQAVGQEAEQADQSRAVSQQAADRQAALAQLALEQAQDELAQAQDNVGRLQDRASQEAATAATGTDATTAANDAATAAHETTAAATRNAAIAASKAAQSQARAKVTGATAAVRGAQRRADEAALKLQEAQTSPNETKARRDLEDAQRQLGRADQDLKDAQVAAERPDRTKDPTGVLAAAAVDKIRAATRDYETAQALVPRLRDDVQTAKVADQRGIQIAQLGLDQAKDDIAQADDGLAQANDELAQATAAVEQAVAPAPPLGGVSARANAAASPAAAAAGNTTGDELLAAQARVRTAERQVQVETLKVQDAQTQPTGAQPTTDTRLRTTELDARAAAADLAAAQAKLAELESGPAGDALAREQRRADLLRDESDAAHAGVEPVQQLLAPFDGVLTSVDVQPGQPADGRTTVGRLAAAGALSVLANASESDVTHLTPDQPVELSFPGLGDQTGTGTIAEISTASTNTAADKATFPVRVETTSTPRNLKLGMTAMLNVRLSEAADALYVPSTALRKLEGHNVLTLVLPNGQLSDTVVQVGGTFGSDVQILDGVKEGDSIAIFSSVPATANADAPKP